MKSSKKKEMSPIVIEVGKRISAIIRQKGLKQRDVAYEAELDVENLRKYMKGRQEMKISTLYRIVTALRVEISDLFKKK